jgi:hypothetical protein
VNLSNENRLLLNCLQTKSPEVALDQIKNLLRLSLNWDDIFESAFRHGVAPLLYTNIRRVNEDHIVGKDVMDRLKKSYLMTAAMNMRLYKELRRILEALKDKRIDVIVLKGAFLAETVYGDIGLRSMGDIDLLVKKEDLSRTDKIMTDLRYVASTLKHSHEWYAENHHHLPPYYQSENGVKVEIHWHIVKLSKPFHEKMIERFWKRARPIKLANTQALALSPEDLLLHLCLHSLSHGFAPKVLLRQLCDISESLKYYEKEFNWIQFQEDMNEYQLTRLIYSTFYFIKKVLGNNITDNVLSQNGRRGVDFRLVELITRQIFVADGDSSIYHMLLVRLFTANGFRDKAKIIGGTVFPSLETLSGWYDIPLSSKRIYLYYLMRFYMLFSKYWSLIFRAFKLRHLGKMNFDEISRDKNSQALIGTKELK